jgi:hypothetical protein
MDQVNDDASKPSKSVEFSELSNVTLYQIVTNLLRQNQTKLDNFNVKITPKLKSIMLILCEREPNLFFEAEDSLSKIIADDKIDSKDVPELINLINLIYRTINKDKKIGSLMDKKEFIKSFVHILIILFIKKKGINNENLSLCAVDIIESSMNLLNTNISKRSNWSIIKLCKIIRPIRRII